VSYRDETDFFYVDTFFNNDAVIPAGVVLTVVISSITNAPSLNTQSGFEINTGDEYRQFIEYAEYMTLTN